MDENNNYKKKYLELKKEYLRLTNQFFFNISNKNLENNKFVDNSFKPNLPNLGKKKIVNNELRVIPNDRLVYTQMQNMFGGKYKHKYKHKYKPFKINEEVKKLVDIDDRLVDLYFTIKMGLFHYNIKKSNNKNYQIKGEEIGKAFISLTKSKLEGKLNKGNKLIKNIIKGINYGKKMGEDKSIEDVLDYAKVLSIMYNRKKKENKNYSINKFIRYIIKLLVRLFDAEYKVISELKKSN